MPDFTRGPWKGVHDIFEIWDITTEDGLYVIGTAYGEANARVMTASPNLYEATRKAKQLASIAADWNLTEVEIDGEMVSIYELLAYFSIVLNEVDTGRVTKDDSNGTS